MFGYTFECRIAAAVIVDVEIVKRNTDQVNWALYENELLKIFKARHQANPQLQLQFAFIHSKIWLRIYWEFTPEEESRSTSYGMHRVQWVDANEKMLKETFHCYLDRRTIKSYVLEKSMPAMGISLLTLQIFGRETTWRQ
ncbi:uncharacterized protein BO97DRAFT_423489 [Aspergillus homomorphus CBS 101889]|uniref:Uncharacterized protein n=1 Tax=Aspergillus homomorphus (strain CBS 101889) TaxID=1450537 RepID=A0A395I0W9_ASPHC|nr:hypothetical protein BO97DRAFT_423489 [Aspergillus homomorphus CBS 101889]RAL13710.1 hypothetical protein BO97DRAFT_423489 [Aspergillus homomorphus CBS 101889]